VRAQESGTSSPKIVKGEVTKHRSRHEGHMAEPQGGPRKIDRWTRVAKRKGVNTSLTSRFSGVRKVRARRHDVETREGARGERSQ
jgi:hypothetical protein